MKIVSVLFLIILFYIACGIPPQSSEGISRRDQEQLSLQAVQSVGMPAIVNFAEKRHMKDILELRDKDTATYTYIVGEGNQRTFLCNSIGYGLPYATQYTNPEKTEYMPNTGYVAVPQADPNALFMPQQAEATWVLCSNPETGKLSPVYVEPKIIVSEFPLSF